ncbi:MAG TPA: GntR family transcriptional regulator [Xanthobacteraceae bacterium]|nr:GntR family transcriptional regulator [Xanthobacteraceae bacterium]
MQTFNEITVSGRPEPAWRDAYRRLRKAIISREFAPNLRLIETDLAQTLGISRTPLREALARLEVDGLVAVAKSGGYAVSDMREDLFDAYDLRAAIEGYSARLAAERISDEEVVRLRKNVTISQSVALSERHTRAELNIEFHEIIVAASRSPKLIHAFTNIRDLILTDEDMTLHSEDAHRSFIREHDLIASAIELRDSEIADRLMRKHLLSARDLLLQRNDGDKSGLGDN